MQIKGTKVVAANLTNHIVIEITRLTIKHKGIEKTTITINRHMKVKITIRRNYT